MDESDEEDGLWKKERERGEQWDCGEIMIVGRVLMRSKRHMKEYNCQENWGHQRHWVVGSHPVSTPASPTVLLLSFSFSFFFFSKRCHFLGVFF